MSEVDLDALAEAYEAGLAAEKAGDIAVAQAAYARALALDPDDRGGVAIRLAALGLAPSPETAPPAYVATLFDQTAERFDDILVEQLGYAVPLMLRDLLERTGVAPGGRLLDLGCGTGLTGIALHGRVDHATGVDLSEGMLDVAHDRECYDELYVGEATGFLEGWDEAPFDLIAATDMLPYLGPLEPLLAAAARALVPGGHLAVSTEAGEGADWAVGPLQRYAHSEAYVRRALAAAGFAVVAMDPITVRYNDGRPIPGHLVLARRA